MCGMTGVLFVDSTTHYTQLRNLRGWSNCMCRMSGVQFVDSTTHFAQLGNMRGWSDSFVTRFTHM